MRVVFRFVDAIFGDFLAAADAAVGLLASDEAAARHGSPAVLRALSRAERAPASIAAF